VSRSFLFVLPRPVHSSASHIAFKRQVRPSATRTSQARARVASRLVRPPGTGTPGCSARRHTLRVYGSPARTRECRATKSRRHAAIARAAQTHQIAVAELQRRHRFAERQLKFVARIRAPENAGRCDCASACLLECSEPGVRLAGRPRCRATQQRAPPMRGGQAVAAAGHLARCQAPAGAHRRQRARVAHTTGLSVSSRWYWCGCASMRTRKVGGSPLDAMLSQRELPHSRHTGTLQATRIAEHVRAVPFELLSSFSTTIEDVSHSQI
jgi:hypothetical protein